MFKSIKMVANQEMLDSDFDKSELLDELNDLNLLQDNLQTQFESSITKKPERWNTGNVYFDYSQKWETREIVTEKAWGTYKVRIKKRINGKWYTQKFWNNDTYEFPAKNEREFNKKLWSALDIIVGQPRDAIPTTGKVVYNMLNARNEQNQQNWNGNVEHNWNWGDTQPENREELSDQMPKWLELDHWTYVYEVQRNDCESVIKQKLSNYTPLNYLKSMPNGINWFNFSSIPDKKLLPWLKIIVPKPDTERVKTISDFKNAQKSALNTMKNNATYWDIIDDLIEKYWEDHIANVMTAYAISETCPENSNNEVWKLALFRYERNPKYQCPSYGYHHVLYKWIWLDAFKNSWVTIWESCNPKWSWMLFLAFCIEKAEHAQLKENRDVSKFFDMDDTERCARFYNWSGDIQNYSNKLKNNFEKAKNN